MNIILSYFKIIFCFLLLTIPVLLTAQTKNLTVSEVTFSGLKKTKSSYLYRFLETKKDSLVNPDIIARDVQVLKNLYSIANASTQLDTTAAGVHVDFKIQEALTLFPIVNFGGIKGNLWGQLGFTDVNFLGRGNQFTAYYLNNQRRHNAALYYRVPYWGRSKWGSSASFLRWATVEPAYFDEGAVIYNYNFTSTGLSVIYEIKNDHTLEFGANYFVEDYEKLAEQSISNPPGPDKLTLPKMLLKTTHIKSMINYHFFYLSGWNNSTHIENVQNLTDGVWFHVFKNDFRYYKRVNKLGNVAFRARFGISTNISTPFAPFVVDSQINIRGVGNRRDRGTAVLTINAEYRQTIFDITKGIKKTRRTDEQIAKGWDEYEVEYFDKEGKIAVQLVGFTDIGGWRSPGGKIGELIDMDQARFFVGAGLRLIYKNAYNAILRVDYGVDVFDRNERGFVIGTGQYF
jgi:outer membrane protein assembly factor BamA